MNVHKSLRDNLSYKTLIEYPVLHVILRDHWKDYPLKGPGKKHLYLAINVMNFLNSALKLISPTLTY